MPNPTGENVKKLTPDQEQEAINLYRAGEKTTDIQHRYGITQGVLYSLLKREDIPLRRPGRGGGVGIDNQLRASLKELRNSLAHSEAQLPSATNQDTIAYLLKRVADLEAEVERLRAGRSGP